MVGRTVIAVAPALVLALGVAACSSVPDVVFRDEDEQPSGGSRSDGGPAGKDEAYSCPGRPPPQGAGICCPGNVLCMRCQPSQCERCAKADCTSTGTACCAKNTGAALECRAPNTCN